ncbi:MAG: DUF6051 family protein [Deltaproteobacteria bacterium]|jgi:hypothetical protein|nr:DUF6051 family protein [Deltaproteobacteria bacterium]
MSYFADYENLKKTISFEPQNIDLGDGLFVYNLDFVSQGSPSDPQGTLLGPGIPEAIKAQLPKEVNLDSLFVTPDNEIIENKRFRYHLFRKGPKEDSSGLIILLHGFNEKRWDKYLPWAKALVERTSKSVLLFPIAFHMNRAPEIWSETRPMHKVSQYRKKLFPNVLCSTLSNVAISFRMHQNPARFFWSGLESYLNLVSLVKSIRLGEIEAIKSDGPIDFFTYSIGTFLGQILLMTNQDNLFSNSLFVAFCGGPVFNRLFPVSKFILDSEASVSLYSFLVEHLESHCRKDSHLNHYLTKSPEGCSFCAMLNYRNNLKWREDQFRLLAERIYALALTGDEVVTPYEAINTLQGSFREIKIKVDILDFPFPFRHEDPFPLSNKFEVQIDKCFNLVMDKTGGFLQ